MQISSGTRAIVTGASRGIGRAIAEALAERGARLGLLARSAEDLAELAGLLEGEHEVLVCDISARDQVEQAVATFVAATGGLDLLVANAGVAHYGPFAEQPIEQAERMTRINWLGTVYTVHAALPALIDGGGHIVVVSSGAGLRSFPSAAVYGATKAAQRGFADALRHELADSGVSLTTVFPGEIASALHDHEKDNMPTWYRGGPDAVPARELADKIVAAVERDARAVHHPPLVRALGVLHGISPALGDAVLRRLRGKAAAPRR